MGSKIHGGRAEHRCSHKVDYCLLSKHGSVISNYMKAEIKLESGHDELEPCK